MKGAPIRFVVAVIGGWTCLRIAMLLPRDLPLSLASDVLASEAAAAKRAKPAPPLLSAGLAGPHGAGPQAVDRPALRRSILGARREHAPAPGTLALAEGRQTHPPVLRGAASVFPVSAVAVAAAGVLPSPTAASVTDRWSASAWLLARGGANGTLSGGRLGASQAGVRVMYALGDGMALAGRIAMPLGGRGAEAAIGIDWQPARAPVHLVVEQRIGIDGARGGPTAMAIAGVDPTPVALGFRLEAYAQGGAILRSGRAEAFGDGAVRLARPVAAIGGVAIDAGAGGWAAGQRGVTRVDVGPTVGVAVPVAGQRVRMAIDWRQRVAGNARPGSGPTLSIGSDF